jgi:hypothetical protein
MSQNPQSPSNEPDSNLNGDKELPPLTCELTAHSDAQEKSRLRQRRLTYQTRMRKRNWARRNRYRLRSFRIEWLKRKQIEIVQGGTETDARRYRCLKAWREFRELKAPPVGPEDGRHSNPGRPRDLPLDAYYAIPPVSPYHKLFRRGYVSYDRWKSRMVTIDSQKRYSQRSDLVTYESWLKTNSRRR